MRTFPCLCLGFWLFAVSFSHADQIEMQNGDRYNGKLLAMTNSTLVLQSEILGTVTLPREKVSQILMGNAAVTNAAKSVAAKPATALQKKPLLATPGGLLATNSSAARESADQKKVIQQVQDDYLAGADADTKSKYNEVVKGFLTGKLSLGDIRAQAKSAADQLRAARKDLGEDAGIALDGYLAILDSFLKETTSSDETPAKSPPAAPKPRPAGDE